MAKMAENVASPEGLLVKSTGQGEVTVTFIKVETPEHIRRVPEPIKITFPLMAIAHNYQ